MYQVQFQAVPKVATLESTCIIQSRHYTQLDGRYLVIEQKVAAGKYCKFRQEQNGKIRNENEKVINSKIIEATSHW